MLKRIKDKLRDEGGVTILMALFALLVAALVCVVILSAATSTVKQAHADRQSQQDQLTLECAGNMIATSMLNSKCTYEVTVESEEGSTTPLSTSTSDSVVNDDCIIKAKLESTVTDLVKNSAMPATGGSSFCVIASSEEVADTGTPESAQKAHDEYESLVKVDFVMNRVATDELPAYSIVFTINLMDGDSAKETLYLQMEGLMSSGQPTSTKSSRGEGQPQIETTVTPYTCTWGNPMFYRPGDKR